jgi:sugar phosphate isomerase/epimerase
MLAYVKRFGLFDADIVIIVLSSHDWSDAPEFAELGVDFPARRPWCALQEGLTRYLPRYFPGGTAPDALPPDPPPDDPAVQSSLAALRDLIALAERSGAKIAIAQHLEQGESLDRPRPGHDAIMQMARDTGARAIQLGPSFEQARRAGQQPLRDRIHPNALGQRVIAQTLMDWLSANTGRE